MRSYIPNLLVDIPLTNRKSIEAATVFVELCVTPIDEFYES